MNDLEDHVTGATLRLAKGRTTSEHRKKLGYDSVEVHHL